MWEKSIGCVQPVGGDLTGTTINGDLSHEVRQSLPPPAITQRPAEPLDFPRPARGV